MVNSPWNSSQLKFCITIKAKLKVDSFLTDGAKFRIYQDFDLDLLNEVNNITYAVLAFNKYYGLTYGTLIPVDPSTLTERSSLIRPRGHVQEPHLFR